MYKCQICSLEMLDLFLRLLKDKKGGFGLAMQSLGHEALITGKMIEYLWSVVMQAIQFVKLRVDIHK